VDELTLQINLSAGDIAYAELTVPELIEAHRLNADEKLAIVDCCRPPRTQVIDPERRYPQPEFQRRVQKICQIAEALRAHAYFDRVVYLRPGDPLIQRISRRYFRSVIRETHDCWGHGLMAYLAAFEVVKTRYLLHYDADMILYQEPGYDWSVEARQLLSEQPQAIAATPRVSPPFASVLEKPDAPSLHESDVPINSENGFWQVYWFSSRCFLTECTRLLGRLPLLKGPFLWETLLRKVLWRSYPPGFEIMVYRGLCKSGGYRIDLKSEQAFLLHPEDKSSRFVICLPRLRQALQRGHVPKEQRGWENLKLDVWENFLP
jgi:hypothetical protein